MRLLAVVLSLCSGFLCENCIPRPPPRRDYVASDLASLAAKILSVDCLGLGRLEVWLVARDLADKAKDEKGLMKMVGRGEVVKFVEDWTRNALARLSQDYGAAVFDSNLAGLFSPATYWLLYTHHEDIPMLPIPTEQSAPLDTDSEGEECPILMHFPYHFPSARKE